MSWDATKLAAISTIGDALKELLDRIGSLPADAAFGSTGGIAIADILFELLVLADWRISNFNFQNGTSQFGSTGAASWNFGDPRFTLSEAGLVQWGQSLEYARFYILHELAHVTPAGQNFVRIANETGTDESKVAAELWANSFALLLYNTLFESNPPFGQAPEPGFSAEFFYQTSPGDPNGETAEEAFEGCEP